MVLIPTDVGVLLRSRTDAPLHPPVAPIPEIPSELTQLRNGQVFSARIQEVLPENTYKALVAGKSITLSLPEGAKAGDTLELVVVDRTPRSLVAHIVHRGTGTEGAATGAAPFTSLSRAAQMIGALLPREGEMPAPIPLNRGQPLLPQAPAAITQNPQQLAQQLAPVLARAVAQSGLFYESHQVQWARGQRPLAALLAEPQAAHSRPALLAAHGQPRAEEAEAPRSALPATATANPAAPVPEDLRPLVQQQLDAVATQRLVWHGESWPGQAVEWMIEPDREQGTAQEADGERSWHTHLRLTMPRLGGIEARLHLSQDGVTLRLVAEHAEGAEDLRAALPVLETALAAAGIPLRQAHVVPANT